MTVADFSALHRAGLNRQAVLDLEALPGELRAELRRRFDPAQRYRQLILIGHAGKALWEAVQNSLKAGGISPDNPIDEFSVSTVEQWFAANFPGNAQAVIYPGDIPVGLQALGEIAGWHHASPLRIGISAEWGTWFAYRVLLLADTDLTPGRRLASQSPCSSCQENICIASCPAGALAGGTLVLDKCVSYRQAPASRCKTTCIARVSCPVGIAHRYSDQQIHHSYAFSLKMIERYC